jgi:ABC-2 type transport system permease protein
MWKLLWVAHREYTAMIATKAFLFTLVMMPIMMLGGLFILPLMMKIEGAKNRKIFIVDGTTRLADVLKAAVDQRQAMLEAVIGNAVDGIDAKDTPFGIINRDQYELSFSATPTVDDAKRLELSKQIRDGELYAFVEIPEAALSTPPGEAPPSAKFVSNDAALSEARRWFERAVSDAVRADRLRRLDVDPVVVAKADMPMSMEPTRPYDSNPDGSIKREDTSSLAFSMILPLVMMMFMFLVIFLAAQPMMESALEEKSQRISELLLGSVSPSQLMAGKLLGNVSGSLMIFLIYGIGGFFMLKRFDMLSMIPLSLVGWFLVFQVGAVLLFSSVFLTIGASVGQLKEAQAMVMPAWMVMMLPLFVWFIVLRDPNGVLGTGLSFFPFSAPMMMVLRLSSGATVPAWQPPVAALILLVTTAGIVYFAGRIYRVSLLRGDTVKSLLQLLARARGT